MMYGQQYNMVQPCIPQQQHQEILIVQYQALLSEKTRADVEIGRLSERIKDLERKYGVERDSVKRLTRESEDKRNENRPVSVRYRGYMVNPRRRYNVRGRRVQERRNPPPRPDFFIVSINT